MSDDEVFEQRLRRALQAEPAPPVLSDADFGLRVVAALPAQRPRRRSSSRTAAWALKVLALTASQAVLAGLGVAGLPEAQAGVSAVAVLALTTWWCLPRGRLF